MKINFDYLIVTEKWHKIFVNTPYLVTNPVFLLNYSKIKGKQSLKS